MFPNRKRVVDHHTGGLQGLLTNEATLNNLIAYLDAEIEISEQVFQQAAVQAVFNSDARINAAVKHGICEGLRRVRSRIDELVKSGK